MQRSSASGKKTKSNRRMPRSRKAYWTARMVRSSSPAATRPLWPSRSNSRAAPVPRFQHRDGGNAPHENLIHQHPTEEENRREGARHPHAPPLQQLPAQIQEGEQGREPEKEVSLPRGYGGKGRVPPANRPLSADNGPGSGSERRAPALSAPSRGRRRAGLQGSRSAKAPMRRESPTDWIPDLPGKAPRSTGRSPAW